MQQPMSRIGQELENFFKNTLDRNGRGERPDMEDHLFPVFGTGKFVTPSLYGEIDSFYSNLMHIRWQQQQQLGGFGWPSSSSEQSCTSQSSHNRAVLQYQSRNNQKASSVYVPRACSVEQACVPKSSGISEPPVSKGTGTFIPIMVKNPCVCCHCFLIIESKRKFLTFFCIMTFVEKSSLLSQQESFVLGKRW